MKNIETTRFNIDFFEFSFLVEACIPPRPIARAMFWEEVINHYYQVLTSGERLNLFEWINKNPSFNLSNEDCQLFNARFDPDNQYQVKTLYEGTEESRECFKWKDKYHLSKSTSIAEDYIIEVCKTQLKKE